MKRVALIHRLSGIALALFLPVHFWALGRGLELDSFLRWTEQPLVKFAEWGIVVLLAMTATAQRSQQPRIAPPRRRRSSIRTEL